MNQDLQANSNAEATSGARIVFFGTPEFASSILEYLAEHGEQIVGVVTIPDRQQGRGRKSAPSAVKSAAEALSIPVLQPESLRDAGFLAELSALNADIFCVVAFRILPREVFTLPRLGAFNVHGSLLPKYRGAAPINRAIMAGETETGVTTFLLNERVDEGKIIDMRCCTIGENETAGEVHDKLMALGASAALNAIRLLAMGKVQLQTQDDSLATKAPKIFPKDTMINFDQTAKLVHDFVRGLSPYPGALTEMKSVKFKILLTRQQDAIRLAPSKFHVDSGRLFVGTATAALEILRLQREGKRPMDADEFLRGNSAMFT